jgi:RluA family pseudouridine synthase
MRRGDLMAQKFVKNSDLCPKQHQLKIAITKPITLFEFLLEQYPDSPRTRVKKILQSGVIRVNDAPVTLHSFKLKTGDNVEINQHSTKIKKTVLPFPVLYEDENVIVVDKPAGISTSSVDGSKNVHEIVTKFLRDQSKGKVRTYVVHRLDKEVSGVLLFAKSQELMDTLKENWEKTDKHYFALVEGTPEKPEDSIQSWLIEDGRQKVHSTQNKENGKLAITDYKIVRQVGIYTLLDVNTKTGRKNQIRVQLSDIGCPIVGDRKYGASDDFERRVRLHAYSLTFPHPVTGQTVKVQSPMPKGFLVIKEGDEKYK